MPLIELSNVTKTYSEAGASKDVLHRVDLMIDQHELIVLLGRSGSGKSTLLNVISGIDVPTSGDVTIAGKTLTRLSERERTQFRRRHIGFIFQFFNLIPTLTVGENVFLPLELVGIDPYDANRRVEKMLATVGLDDRMHTFPDRLSGGEQQRVAIARALIHEPDIILADEPTGNLDYETGVMIIEILDRLVRKQGKTMMMATHSREVAGMADRILTIKDGGIEEMDGGKS
ncbi:ABC transporter ATP-binding protein [candidate division KSB1 bacterium]|nr:ABC transporter ATP-binding protein [candidate division KSB1 bacterium]